MQRTAEGSVDHMRSLGLENAQVMPTARYPVAYGEWLGAGQNKPTVLVYGHYDVVPAKKKMVGRRLPLSRSKKRAKFTLAVPPTTRTAIHSRQSVGMLPQSIWRSAC